MLTAGISMRRPLNMYVYVCGSVVVRFTSVPVQVTDADMHQFRCTGITKHGSISSTPCPPDCNIGIKTVLGASRANGN
jgi:hypothetical protein